MNLLRNSRTASCNDEPLPAKTNAIEFRLTMVRTSVPTHNPHVVTPGNPGIASPEIVLNLSGGERMPVELAELNPLTLQAKNYNARPMRGAGAHERTAIL